jgi:SAM-dependent methyltransferase
VPARTTFQGAVRRLFHHSPRVEAWTLAALDAVYRITLLPFRRARADGRADERADLVARTDSYNAAAERYFAAFEEPQYLLDKPFSDGRQLPKHLIDAGILIDALRLQPGHVVAEIGAGSCWLSHLLNRAGCATIAIDVSATALALGRQLFERDPRTNWSLEPRFLTYDGHRLPLANGRCDAIVLNDAFHHVPNQRELLLEMRRVLSPDGLVAMSEPGAGHAGTGHSAAEAATGVLENELVLEDVAALAEACGFGAVNVVLATPHVHPQIPARELGAFMGGNGFASYWKAFCSALEQHHYIVLHASAPVPTTRRPGRLSARIDVPRELQAVAGAATHVSVRLTNTGDTTWLAAGAAGEGWTRLGAHLHRDTAAREVIDFDWLRVSLGQDVPAGHTVIVEARLPPMPAGVYLVIFDLVVEGKTWFAASGSAEAIMCLTVGTDTRRFWRFKKYILNSQGPPT